jgi:hypothetical protein
MTTSYKKQWMPPSKKKKRGKIKKKHKPEEKQGKPQRQHKVVPCTVPGTGHTRHRLACIMKLKLYYQPAAAGAAVV